MSEQTTFRPVIRWQKKFMVIIEDEPGFSVRRAITYSGGGPAMFTHAGQVLGTPADLNKDTKDTHLDWEDALLLALRMEKFHLKNEGLLKTKKKK